MVTIYYEGTFWRCSKSSRKSCSFSRSKRFLISRSYSRSRSYMKSMSWSKNRYREVSTSRSISDRGV